MEPGTTVKYARPMNDDEAAARFIVKEDRGERVLIELVCDLPIRPTECVAVDELVATAAASARLEGAELRELIGEVSKCVRQMEKNRTTRSSPGVYRSLKERLIRLSDQWQQTPDAAEYARTHR